MRKVIMNCALCLILSFVLVALAGCTAGNNPIVSSKPDETTTPNNSIDSTETPSQTYPVETNSITEPDHTQTPEQETYSMYFDWWNERPNELAPFAKNGLSVNRILKTVGEDKKLFVGVVNTKAEIIYKVELGPIAQFSEYNTISNANFEVIGNGDNMVAFKIGNSSGYGEYEYYLVNSSGKELISSKSGAIDSILAVGGDRALVYKNESTISSDVQKLGVMDSNGNWVLPLTQQDIHSTDAQYLGCDIFAFFSWTADYYATYLFNGKDNIWSDYIKINKDLETDKPEIGNFYADTTGVGGALMRLDMPYLGDDPDRGLILMYYSEKQFKGYYVFSNDTDYSKIDNMKIVDDRAIFTENDNGNLYYQSIKIPEWEGYIYSDFYKAKYLGDANGTSSGIKEMNYFGDIFVAEIYGKDKKYYFVILNKEMDAISEPIPGWGSVVSYENGHILYSGDGYTLMDINGKTVNDSFPEGTIYGFNSGISIFEYNVHKYTEYGDDYIMSNYCYIIETGTTVLSELVDKSK